MKCKLARRLCAVAVLDETKTNVYVELVNRDTQATRLLLLVPHLIDGYGFYEGMGTPYRVDPRGRIVEVLDFLKPAGGLAESKLLLQSPV